MPEQNKRDFWLYVGLVISGLLNLTGMASIVDGLVTWARFFREIIDVYRTVIREPLAYVGNQIWPFGHIPHWIFDVFVLQSTLFLAVNIVHYRDQGKTLFGELYRSYRDAGPMMGLLFAFMGLLIAFTVTILMPYTLIAGVFFGYGSDDALERAKNRKESREILQNVLFILATFAVILFINWQLKKFT